MDKYQEKRSFIGKFMFNFTLKCSTFLSKHLWLYYLLNYTWGILTVLFGYIILGFIHIFLRNKIADKDTFGPCYFIQIGDNWGGLELGINFILADNMGKEWTLHTKQHELGHTFQNAILGPFFIFLVSIPSAIRYWLHRFNKLNHDYDFAWFEGNASYFGNYYYNNYIIKK